MITKKNNSIFYVIIGVFFVVLVGTPFYFKKNLSVGEYISAVWRMPQLLEENQRMRMQVEDLKSMQQPFDGFGQLTADGLRVDGIENTIPSKVYSLYPFNTKNRIFINKGSQDGIQKEKSVLASGTILIGVVQNVSKDKSEITTPYDTSFALPVRIGAQETDALLQGGISPRLMLIDKSKQVLSGDKIITASKDMPYGLLVGYVKEVSEDVSGAFFQATIDVPYNLNALKTVYVLAD